jgi:hypothetical protein
MESLPSVPSWVVITVVFMAVMIGTPMLVRQIRKVRGPVVAGWARVQSLRQFGSVANNGPARMICRLRLTIEIPGREPYDVTRWKNIAPWDLGGYAPGSTVPVEVSETNPKKLRFGHSAGSPFVGGGPVRSTRTVYNLPPKITINGVPATGDDLSALPNVLGIVDALQQAGAPQNVADLFAGNAVASAADLLATGQRVTGVLTSFAPTGTTPRSLGRTPSSPDLIDAPHYRVGIEFHFPNLAPVEGQAILAVPQAWVPSLAIGRQLPCAVDPANPARRFAVDWAAAGAR